MRTRRETRRRPSGRACGFGWTALLALALLGPVHAARADLPTEIVRAFGLSAPGAAGRDLAEIQQDLLWIGQYRGQIDGQSGNATRQAARDFQLSIGQRPTGQLTLDERQILSRRAVDTRRDIDLRVEDSDWTGIRMPVPRGYVGPGEVDGSDHLDLLFEGQAAVTFSIAQIRFRSGSVAPDPGMLARSIVAEEDDAVVIVAGKADGTGYYLVRVGELRIYAIFETARGETRGVLVTVPDDQAAAISLVVAEVLSGTTLFSREGVAFGDVARRIADGDYPGLRDKPDWFRTMKGNGSGSLVSTEGHVLTNHHVVNRCDRITVQGQPADLIGSDVRLDLAIVQAARFSGREPIAFRTEPARLGERVTVLGWPVFSVTQSLNATEGIVSGALGYKGSRLGHQISAPVQPGNSGGPALDSDGRQIGVVVQKAGSAMRGSGGVENIAWVVRGDIARAFLDRYAIRYRTDNATRPEQPLGDVVARQRDKALRVECH
ncbi:MAG: trypsin-like peptidase domain-containing protein [Hyphomonas sp.]